MASRARTRRSQPRQLAPGQCGHCWGFHPHTPERCRQGAFERTEVADAGSVDKRRTVRPYQAVDTLTRMLRRHTISGAMHRAAGDFRAKFARAQLDQLRAQDYSAQHVDGKLPADKAVALHGAREAVWRDICAVGGLASPGGSVLWHVVGLELSLKEWALQQGWGGRTCSQEAASGILVGALGVLAVRYGHAKPGEIDAPAGAARL